MGHNKICRINNKNDTCIEFFNENDKRIFSVWYDDESDCCASTYVTYELDGESLCFSELDRYIGSSYLGITDEDVEYCDYVITTNCKIKIDDDIITIQVNQSNGSGCCGYMGFNIDGEEFNSRNKIYALMCNDPFNIMDSLHGNDFINRLSCHL
jgi:hypothetical protein